VIVALLALLGVDLGVILVILGAALYRRRAVKGRRGAFKGKLRVTEGELDGFSSKWKTGYGHWVHDVLVWNPAPLYVRTQLIPVDGTDASGIRAANGRVRGLGKRPVVAPLVGERRRRFELATAEEDHDAALGPFAQTSAVGSLVRGRFAVGGSEYANDN
jgi:hypothetical protein